MQPEGARSRPASTRFLEEVALDLTLKDEQDARDGKKDRRHSVDAMSKASPIGLDHCRCDPRRRRGSFIGRQQNGRGHTHDCVKDGTSLGSEGWASCQ